MKEPRPPAAAWHWDGHREYVKSPTPAHPDHTERIFSEIFTSEGFLEEEEKVKQLPPEKNDDGTNCDLPRAIAGLMLYSDGTQLGNVGANKLWPVMAFPGNQSKAARVNGKGTGRDCYHIAYLPSVRSSSKQSYAQSKRSISSFLPRFTSGCKTPPQA